MDYGRPFPAGNGRIGGGVLRNETMDDKWPLFEARISDREATENEARLLEASRRLWPAALTAVKNQVSETPSLAADPKSITTQCWEKALFLSAPV